MNVKHNKVFSNTLKKNLEQITLSNKNLSLVLCNYGAMITNIFVNSTGLDIVLGCKNIDDYIKNTSFFGATIGRYANRIENGVFSVNNHKYSVSLNEIPNHLHGGFKGFDKQIWDYKTSENSVVFSYFSKNLEEGYPGNLNVKVKYSLSDDDEILIEYFGISNKDTILNMTNHSYFNLNGENSNTVKNHIVKINSEFITEFDSNNIPTGKLIDISSTNFDFNIERSFYDALSDSNTILNKDYDHNYLLKEDIDLKASIYSPITNIKLNLYTSYPCMQLYTGSNLNNAFGKTRHYSNFSSICLEPQYAPNSINIKDFKQPILKKDEKYYQYIKYKFQI